MNVTYFKRFKMEIDLQDAPPVPALPEGYFWVAWDEGLLETHDYDRWLTPEGCLRAEIVERIGTIIPEVKTAPDATKISIAELLNWITVATLVRIVEQKRAYEHS